MDACHLYLDSADLGALKNVLPHPLVYGVTTNPTLFKKAGLMRRDLAAFVSDILAAGVRAVHLQAVGHTRDELIASGLEHAQLAASGSGEPGRIVVKLPATREGFAAAAKLTAEGVRVTVTAVYRPEQVLLAASAGASYAAPYLGRLQDGGHDGLAVVGQMQALLERYAVTPTRLLVASVRSRETVVQLLELGVGSITLPPALFAELLSCPETDEAAATFLQDAQAL